jgi:hypothetical protein
VQCTTISTATQYYAHDQSSYHHHIILPPPPPKKEYAETILSICYNKIFDTIHQYIYIS